MFSGDEEREMCWSGMDGRERETESMRG